MTSVRADPGPVDRDLPAARVVATTLERYRSDARAEVPGMLAGDVEALHQYRVAMRRARGLLTGAKGVIPADRRREASGRLKEMGDLTSPVRDLDVLLEDLPGRLGAVGAEPGQHAVEALRGVLARARVGPYRELCAAVADERGAQLMAAWARAAEVNMVGSRGERALRPAGSVADADLEAAWRRCRRAGDVAAASDDLEHWHDLRKALKRFRYQLESFAPMYTGTALRRVRRDLRSLQDTLGHLQDGRVQQVLLGEAAAAAERHGEEGAAVLARALTARLEADLDATHRRCAEVWARFDTPRTRSDVERLVSGS
jgi:CHAD domain-containing protein